MPNQRGYRLQHPLAQRLIKCAKGQPLSPAKLHMHYDSYGAHVSVVKQLIGRSGTLAVSLLGVESLGSKEDCAAHGESFAFETTRSGLAYLRHIHEWKNMGYHVSLFF